MESRLQAHTDQKLEAMESRLLAQIVALKDYTDQKLEAMESRLLAQIVALKDYTDQKLDALELRLREHTETVETRLLSEFWKWARTSDIKARNHSTSLAAMDERLMSVEERLRDLELRRRPGNGA
jgi:hypothetical protein